MALATTLQQYLADQKIAYEIITHRPTISSSMSAEASHVSGDCIAKGVIVKDEDRFMMAVLPASHHVKLGDLSSVLGRAVRLATEDEASELFPDCSTRRYSFAGRSLWRGHGRRRQPGRAARGLLRGRRPYESGASLGGAVFLVDAKCGARSLQHAGLKRRP